MGKFNDDGFEDVLGSDYDDYLNYDYEDALDLTGLIVKAKYNDGTEKVIDGWTSEPTATIPSSPR